MYKYCNDEKFLYSMANIIRVETCNMIRVIKIILDLP